MRIYVFSGVIYLYRALGEIIIVMNTSRINAVTTAMMLTASTYEVHDVIKFLGDLGLDQYTASFEEAGMTGENVLEADDETWEDLGVINRDKSEILTHLLRRIEKELEM